MYSSMHVLHVVMLCMDIMYIYLTYIYTWGTKFEDNNSLKSNIFYNPTNPSQELSNIVNSINNTNTIIQKADKVNTFVILNKEFL